MKTIRTPAQKLGYYKKCLRDLWHKSPMYWEAWHRAHLKVGISKCEECGSEINQKLIEIDHMEPVVVPGQDPADISLWAARLNCPASLLKALCESCHRTKTAAENSQRHK